MDHIRDYFARRESEMNELGLVPDDESPFAEFGDAEGNVGRLFTRFGLSERSFLAVNERVRIENGSKHRIRYAYYLVTDGAEVWGYERDPTHYPPEHRHDPAHKRFPANPVSFRWAAEEAWRTFQDAEDLAEHL